MLWRLLQRHTSLLQLTGFCLANLVGMLVIMLGVQIYADGRAISKDEDLLMREDYLIINKEIGMLSAITEKVPTFDEEEIEEIEQQEYVSRVGRFTTSAFHVNAYFDMGRQGSFGTEMFFEAVPDDFVDVKTEKWIYSEGDDEIPIIIPKSYLDLYNFGFAQSRQMPKLSESIISAIRLRIVIHGNGMHDTYSGRIVGFSNRLQTILVPQSFIDYANNKYAPTERDIVFPIQPSRLILRVDGSGDERLAAFMQEHGYQTDADKLKASKDNYLLKLIVTVIVAVGLVISVLALYILMLSIFLLVQKNSDKLQNLLLIGYSTARVAQPYQLLTWLLNIGVCVVAFISLHFIRTQYVLRLEAIAPDIDFPDMTAALITGIVLTIVVSILNSLSIRLKINSLRK